MKKKFKEVHGSFHAAPYPSGVEVIITTDPSRSIATLNKNHKGIDLPEFSPNTRARCSERFHGKSNANYQFLMFNSKFMSADVVSHEALHATNNILTHAGVELDPRNDEPQAYLLSAIVDRVYEIYKTYKKK